MYVDQNPARTRWKKNRFLNIEAPFRLSEIHRPTPSRQALRSTTTRRSPRVCRTTAPSSPRYEGHRPRFWTMKGYRVNRTWGWDCHGLPVGSREGIQPGCASDRGSACSSTKPATTRDLCRGMEKGDSPHWSLGGHGKFLQNHGCRVHESIWWYSSRSGRKTHLRGL